jgi:hypothetical protein
MMAMPVDMSFRFWLPLPYQEGQLYYKFNMTAKEFCEALYGWQGFEVII